MDIATGTLEGDHVTVAAGREASTLHSKGSHGTPKSGGGLTLSLVESAYLVESGRLRLAAEEQQVPFEGLLRKGSAGDERFELLFLVYRDFRERGFVIREEPASAKIDFSVRARGGTAKSPSKTWVRADSERGAFKARESADYAERAEGIGKEALAAVVDEEGDITYYAFEAGLKPAKTKGHGTARAEGALSGNHVLVEGEGAKALHAEDEHLGKPLKHLLRLSLIEAAYLVEEGRLTLMRDGAKSVSVGELAAHAGRHQRDFAHRLAVYRALREAGLIPKTGFKYGAHFRVYDREGGTTHARYLVHAVPEDFSSTWPELARAVRLAHGVKKRLAFALVGDGGAIRFLRVRWTRP